MMITLPNSLRMLKRKPEKTTEKSTKGDDWTSLLCQKYIFGENESVEKEE